MRPNQGIQNVIYILIFLLLIVYMGACIRACVRAGYGDEPSKLNKVFTFPGVLILAAFIYPIDWFMTRRRRMLKSAN